MIGPVGWGHHPHVLLLPCSSREQHPFFFNFGFIFIFFLFLFFPSLSFPSPPAGTIYTLSLCLVPASRCYLCVLASGNYLSLFFFFFVPAGAIHRLKKEWSNKFFFPMCLSTGFIGKKYKVILYKGLKWSYLCMLGLS